MSVATCGTNGLCIDVSLGKLTLRPEWPFSRTESLLKSGFKVDGAKLLYDKDTGESSIHLEWEKEPDLLQLASEDNGGLDRADMVGPHILFLSEHAPTKLGRTKRKGGFSSSIGNGTLILGGPEGDWISVSGCTGMSTCIRNEKNEFWPDEDSRGRMNRYLSFEDRGGDRSMFNVNLDNTTGPRRLEVSRLGNWYVWVTESPTTTATSDLPQRAKDTEGKKSPDQASAIDAARMELLFHGQSTHALFGGPFSPDSDDEEDR